MSYQFPESVRSYYGDLAVQSGVDALLTKPQKLPPDLQWDELADYYRAWLAAHRVVIDHAVALDGIWNAVWRDTVLASWSIASPDDQLANDGNTDPHPMANWANGWHVRCLHRGKDTLYAAVALDASGLTLGFGFYNHRGTLSVKTAEGFVYEAANDMLWLEEPLLIADGKVDLDVLRRAADRAIAAFG